MYCPPFWKGYPQLAPLTAVVRTIVPWVLGGGPFETFETLKVTVSGLALLEMIPMSGGLMLITVPVKTASALWNACSGVTAAAHEHACAAVKPWLTTRNAPRNDATRMERFLTSNRGKASLIALKVPKQPRPI